MTALEGREEVLDGPAVVAEDLADAPRDARPELFDVLEFEPQTAWVELPGAPTTYRPDERVLDRLAADSRHKLVHSIGTPIGGTVRTSNICWI